MKFTFWGVRGSFPTSRPESRVLGGNTSCISLEAEGHLLVLDAGSGIRRLGDQLMNSTQGRPPIDILFSHAHWDHILGFPHFSPAYSERFSLRLHSVRRLNSTLQQLLSYQQESGFFPVSLDRLSCELSYAEMDEGETTRVGPFTVTARRLNHPGIAAGFRVQYGENVFAYVSDVAPSRDILMADTLPWSETQSGDLKRLYENQLHLARNADVVVYDTFFTPQQYQERKHWGHSTAEDGIQLCREAQAKNLFIFHHNPEISDAIQIERQQDLQATEDSVKLHLSQELESYSFERGELKKCG